ncbi:MAG TPA: superoxide dismutase family protein [Candidatus Angelobacter sp.]|nr:superoxide dismutase family protein [Candidatus Angelobacter sp.]
MQVKTKMSMMLKLGFIAIAAFVVVVPALAKNPKPVTVTVNNSSGQKVGTATLSQVANGVKIELNVHDLVPGEHAIHVHQNAKCDVPDFKTAGGHFNPDNKHHGLQNPEGPHAGDIPNFIVTVNGKSKATVIAAGITLSDGPHSVFTSGGTALVIHAKPDDGKTDPSGNAGDRVACGLITK